jgi:peroxiredoxin
MRSIFSLLICLALSMSVGAQSAPAKAYEIKVTMKPFTSGYLYLGHHFGTKQYLVDSARLNERSEAVFSGKEKLFGGVYMIVYPRKNGWLEFIVDKQQKFTIISDSADVINKSQFPNSPDNILFSDYQKKSFQIGTKYKMLSDKLNGLKGQDSVAVREQMATLSREVQDYRENFRKQHPEHLLSGIFAVLKDPVIPPAGSHPGGKYDSVYAYQYYKSHYWDGINLKDERLLRTPVYIPKFDRYFGEVIPQASDSIIPYASAMLEATKPDKEMFKYTLSALTDKYVNPTYMGQDKVFVYLFEKYYLPGAADSWMTEKYKKFIFDRGYSLMANQLGEKGANLELIDTLGKVRPLYDVDGKYVILCFWDPTCSHCQAEMPKLDSMFQNKWKAQGIRIYGVMTDGGKEAWLKYIRTHHLKDWIHVYQTQEMKDAESAANRPGFRQLYDVYQTPMLYLLDKDKRIIAKKLSYEQLDQFLEVSQKKSSKP